MAATKRAENKPPLTVDEVLNTPVAVLMARFESIRAFRLAVEDVREEQLRVERAQKVMQQIEKLRAKNEKKGARPSGKQRSSRSTITRKR